jgi:hypothetical protein
MNTTKIGGLLIILGMVMFVIGVSLFSYTGHINPMIKSFGEISFLGWLPTIMIGIIILVIGIVNKK